MIVYLSTNCRVGACPHQAPMELSVRIIVVKLDFSTFFTLKCCNCTVGASPHPTMGVFVF